MPAKPSNPAAAIEIRILAAIVVVGAVLRLATLDLQSYTHEEAVTASRVLHPGLWDTLSAIPDSESTPPFYYLLAWLWSVPFGVGEVALRSLSALFGFATIPVAYLAGRELGSRRIGLVAAALVAVSPMLIWYSQLARGYSLLVLLSALSFLYTVRSLRDGSGRDLAAWAVLSSLALATHYFAIFLVAAEAAAILVRLRSRAAVGATALIVVAGLALLPLALHQADIPNNDWVSNERLLDRIEDVPRKFLVGETGAYLSIYGRGAQSAYLNRALIPAALVVVALVLLFRLAEDRERRAARLAFGIGGSAVLAATVLALIGPDYLLARNLLPAYVPLAIVVACGLGARRAGWPGTALAGGLCAVLGAFAVYASARPALRHDDWRAVADALEPSPQGRAIVAPFLGDDPLIYYLDGRVRRDDAFTGRVREVAIVGYGPPRGRLGLPPAFKPRGREKVSYFTVTYYRAPRPTLVHARRIERPQSVGSTKAALLIDRPS
jgi:Dolichyl-phosphate-mannose-protein mannosyltransferase